MKIQIVTHLLPHELDDFEWQIKQLRMGLQYLTDFKKYNITFCGHLNFNLVDWELSSLPKRLFINKFIKCEDLLDWCDTDLIISDDGSIMGSNDTERYFLNKYDSDITVYLDADIVFNITAFASLLSSIEIIQDDYFIISPEITKIWDNYWDHLTNENYINKTPGHDQYYSRDPFSVNINKNRKLQKTYKILFATGWFNVISTNLLRYTDIPESFGPYGTEDTYISFAAEIMKKHGLSVNQYKVKNEIIIENYKFRINPYEKYLTMIDRKQEFREQAEAALLPELQNFRRKLMNDSSK